MRTNVVGMFVVMAIVFMLCAGTAAEVSPVTSGICIYRGKKTKPERVYFSKTTVTLKVGRIYRLKVWTSSSKNVKGEWRYGRSSVVSVDSTSSIAKAKSLVSPRFL